MNAQELINEILKVLQPALLAILTTLSTYIGFQVSQYIKSKIANEKLKKIKEHIKASVVYIEQITGVNVIYTSIEKLEFAKARAIFLLEEAGLQASEELIETLIEGFVKGMNDAKRHEELFIEENDEGMIE